MEVSVKSIKAALEGRTKQLYFAFDWGDTPQGYSYWNSQHEGENPLDRRYLIDLLRQNGVDYEGNLEDLGLEVGDVVEFGYEYGAKLVELGFTLLQHEIKRIDGPNKFYSTESGNTQLGNAVFWRVVSRAEDKLKTWGQASELCLDDTHRITFDTVDGEPDCDSIKMEKL